MRFLLASSLVVFSSILSACSSTSGEPSTLSKMSDFALQAIGIQEPESLEVPEIQKAPRKILVKFHAGGNLNAGTDSAPLSLITRVYKLRQTAAFYATPYDSFLSPEKEKAALGVDLVDVRELNLVPGKLYQATESVPREAEYIGVVGFFMSPAPGRWRLTFSAADAEALGITLGVHACSFTVGKGAAADQSTLVSANNAPARCP